MRRRHSDECLAALEPRARPAIVVGHGACLKVALVALLGWPAEPSARCAGLDNCAWAVLDQHGAEAGSGWRRTTRPVVVAPGPRTPISHPTRALAKIPRVVRRTAATLGLWRSW